MEKYQWIAFHWNQTSQTPTTTKLPIHTSKREKKKGDKIKTPVLSTTHFIEDRKKIVLSLSLSLMEVHCCHCTPSMASCSINMYHSFKERVCLFQTNGISRRWRSAKMVVSYGNTVCCSAAQDSATTATVADNKETKPASGATTEKPKPAAPAKAPAKSLPELMEEEVIPSLRTTLEEQDDISQLELFYRENRLEGSFLKNDVPHYFWAFFPDGVLTGPKGFSLSSYGSGVSTVEPFLIDEKRITSKHVVFWVVKRLAAQGILPVWKE